MESRPDEPRWMDSTVAGVATGPPYRIPVVVVEARVAQRGRILGEAEGVAALGGDPANFGGGQLGIPDDGDGHRDEPGGIGPAPLVDVPVVVGAHEGQRELGVVTGEDPGREGGEGREVHGGQHAPGVHVLHPLVHVVAAGPDLVEALGLEAVLLPGPPRHRVERRRLHHHLAEGPDVGPLVVADQGRRPVQVLGVEVMGEEIRRLDDVVVDTDQNEIVNLAHGLLLRMILSK